MASRIPTPSEVQPHGDAIPLNDLFFFEKKPARSQQSCSVEHWTKPQKIRHGSPHGPVQYERRKTMADTYSKQEITRINAIVIKSDSTDENIINNQRNVIFDDIQVFIDAGLSQEMFKREPDGMFSVLVCVEDDFIGNIPNGNAQFSFISSRKSLLDKFFGGGFPRVYYVKNKNATNSLRKLLETLYIPNQESVVARKIFANRYANLLAENIALKEKLDALSHQHGIVHPVQESQDPVIIELPKSCERTYFSLVGEMVSISEHEKRFRISISQMSFLFKDPITMEYICDPVILNGNVYDKSSITKWLSKSNIDPLNGIVLEGEIKLIPFLALRYILLCSEFFDDDNIIYHSVPQDPRFASYVGENFPLIYCKNPVVTQDVFRLVPKWNGNFLSVFDNMYLLNLYAIPKNFCQKEYAFCDFTLCKEGTTFVDGCRFINCLLPQWMQEKYDAESNIRYFYPQELLFTDAKTGDFISMRDTKSIYITQKGYIIHARHKEIYPDAVPLYAIQDKLTDCVIESKIEMMQHNFSPVFHEHTSFELDRSLYCDPYTFCDNDELIDKTISATGNSPLLTSNVEPADLRVRATSPVDKIRSRIVELARLFDTDESYYKSLTKISEHITPEHLTMGSTYLQSERQLLGIPFFAEISTYSKDLSFMQMENKTFSKIEFKDSFFVRADLRNTKFIECSFSLCYFIGANLSGTKFIDCKFTDCEHAFLDVITDNETSFDRFVKHKLMLL
jgi:hypothetical protein